MPHGMPSSTQVRVSLSSDLAGCYVSETFVRLSLCRLPVNVTHASRHLKLQRRRETDAILPSPADSCYQDMPGSPMSSGDVTAHFLVEPCLSLIPRLTQHHILEQPFRAPDGLKRLRAPFVGPLKLWASLAMELLLRAAG